MEITAQVKFARISPKKVQPLLADLRRRQVDEVLQGLRYARSKAGKMLYKVIASAVANATNNYNFKTDNLKIKSLVVDEGPRYKRYWFRSHGSADVRLKRSAHLKVVLEEIVPVKIEKKPVKTTLPSKSVSSAPIAAVSAAAPAKPDKSGGLNKPAGRLGGKKIFTRTTNK